MLDLPFVAVYRYFGLVSLVWFCSRCNLIVGLFVAMM
jgi:hypothetical protein